MSIVTGESIALLGKLKETLIGFIDALMEIMPDDGDLPIAHVYLQTQADYQQGMLHIVKKLVPWKSELYSCIRNVEQSMNAPFVEDGSIYGGALTDTRVIEKYKNMWTDPGQLTDQNRIAIMKWSCMLIRVAEQYMEVVGIISPDDVQ